MYSDKTTTNEDMSRRCSTRFSAMEKSSRLGANGFLTHSPQTAKNREEDKNNVLKPFLISQDFRKLPFQSRRLSCPELDEGGTSEARFSIRSPCSVLSLSKEACRRVRIEKLFEERIRTGKAKID
jgi:hypothetical protein